MRTRTIKNYVLFELSMKGLTLLLLSPLLNACFQAYLGSRGSQVRPLSGVPQPAGGALLPDGNLL